MPATITFQTLGPIIAIGAVTLACATGNREVSHDYSSTSPRRVISVDADAAPPPSRPADIIGRAEIAANPILASGSAYDVVARLRPSFLRARDPRVTNAIADTNPRAVFINGVFTGGLEALRGIPVSSIVQVRYMRAIDAVHRYGPSYSAGVILVSVGR